MPVLSLDRIRTLLREHDDPHHRERPRDFGPEDSAHRFARLTGAMQQRFGPSCTSGLYQDAGVYGVVSVPAAATGRGRLWVELSNFGGFVCAGTGADWSAAGAAEGLDVEFVRWLDELCTAAGCVYVPLDVLLEPYDGPTPTLADEDRTFVEALAAAGHDVADDEEEPAPPVWADRYFQWV
ncbi:hypothetical protein ACIQ6R_05085 [Streptomyces sp. NPDC096048]|uniref:hypothetical protein n=1 Tax=Streptomyces sp. NPDC096048 TaxID=3366072 RepID=UPI0038115CCC